MSTVLALIRWTIINAKYSQTVPLLAIDQFTLTLVYF